MNRKMSCILMIRLRMIGSPSSSGESFWMRFNLVAALPKRAPTKRTRPRHPRARNWGEVEVRGQQCAIRSRNQDKGDLARPQSSISCLDGLCGHTRAYIASRLGWVIRECKRDGKRCRLFRMLDTCVIWSGCHSWSLLTRHAVPRQKPCAQHPHKRVVTRYEG